MKKLFYRGAALFLLVLCAMGTAYAGPLLPDVTSEMTKPAFWSALNDSPQSTLVSAEEIAAVNAAYMAEPGSNMHDLRNAPEFFDGLKRVESLKAGMRADAEYYIGWTYDPNGEKTTMEFFEPSIQNAEDPDAAEQMPVRYGITVNRTELLSFPSDTPIPDDPADPDFEYRSLVGLRVNEPVLVYTTSADGKYYQVVNTCCSGWASTEDIALCVNREEWLSAWEIPAEKRLVVWGDKWFTDTSIFAPSVSRRYLTMGTVLERLDTVPGELVINRLPVHNYAVYLPVRESDGSYRKQPALINARASVSEGYLPLTVENIAKVAFAALGDAYGWGGMMDNEDCTSYVRNIYACFGLDLPRNGNWQWEAPIPKLDLANTSSEEKSYLLDNLPLGTILTFPGHQVLYLGQSGGKYYVISSASSSMSPWQEGARQRLRSICVNTLEMKRTNGQTWLQAVNRAYFPWMMLGPQDENPLPDYRWYHDGVAFCLSHGAIKAETGGYLRLSDALTRAEAVEMLWNLNGAPDIAEIANSAPEETADESAAPEETADESTAPEEAADGSAAPLPEPVKTFDDIPDDASYAKAVQWAQYRGIVEGATEKTFDPDGLVNRQQFAAILYRAVQPEGSYSGLEAFPDAGLVAEWAKDAMSWCVETGLIQGKADHKLHPSDSITRAQAAVILYRFSQLTQEESAAESA